MPIKRRRRCQRLHCPNWIALDEFRPGDDHRRYCSDKCERQDELEIEAVESANEAKLNAYFERESDPAYYGLRIAWESTLRKCS